MTMRQTTPDSDIGDGSQGSRVKLEFEKDLRSNALIQMLGRPQRKKDPSQVGFTSQVCPLLVVIGVSSLQILMAYATYCYVTNNMIYSMRNPLLTSYEMFVGTNNTVPHGLVNELCGDWEDLEMTPENTGELNHITMPDGSTYKPGADFSMFYMLKSPFRTFNYNYLGLEGRSVLDNTLYVIHEGVSFNPTSGAGYSLLFILMSAVWLFALLIEFRSLLHNLSFLQNFHADPQFEDKEECFAPSEDDPDKFRMVQLPMRGRIVLVINIITRAVITSSLACVGCFFIMYTTEKIELILNSLAVLFVLELDQIIFLATVSGHNQELIDDIEPVAMEFEGDTWGHMIIKYSSMLLPAFPFIVNLSAAVFLRALQVRIFHRYFNMTVALCLFAGPTPGGETNLLNPVTGLCDSLLGATCAPSVSPNSTLVQHGPCVITDQKVATVGTTFLYLDDPSLFADRVDKFGEEQSWAKWGRGREDLYTTGIWSHGPYQDIMRKNCLQMYQVSGVPENRLVDDDVIETMPGAPFYCQRDTLWKAVFGKFTEGRAAATDITINNMEQVADLTDPEVVAALDACRSTPRVSPHPGYPYNNANFITTNAHVQRKTARTEQRKRLRKLGSARTLAVDRPQKKEGVIREVPVEDTSGRSLLKNQKKRPPTGVSNIQKALRTAANGGQAPLADTLRANHHSGGF